VFLYGYGGFGALTYAYLQEPKEFYLFVLEVGKGSENATQFLENFVNTYH